MSARKIEGKELGEWMVGALKADIESGRVSDGFEGHERAMELLQEAGVKAYMPEFGLALDLLMGHIDERFPEYDSEDDWIEAEGRMLDGELDEDAWDNVESRMMDGML